MTEITWIGKHQHVAYDGVKWWADPEGRWREVVSLNAQEVIIYWPPLGEPLVDELRTDAMITKDDLI